jgi:CDGSH-type Zn-finger protein/uncharacterized Fe-S cluster protein YjdI
MKPLQRYRNSAVEVTFNPKRCIHSAECVRRMPEVFRPTERPWVVLEGAGPEEVQAVVERCPTGALQFARLDGSYQEQPQAQAEARVMRNGPLYVRGDLEMQLADGSIAKETRVALCRCGLSQSKPYCDNSHQGRFDDVGATDTNRLQPVVEGAAGKVTIQPAPNGPLLLKGNVRVDVRGGPVFEGGGGALCRCGASKSKPFCDGSHKAAGFSDA